MVYIDKLKITFSDRLCFAIKHLKIEILQVNISITPIVLLVLFWVVLSLSSISGHYPILLSVLGLFSCFWAVMIVRRMDIADDEGNTIKLISFKIIPYWIWLCKEIAVSCLGVAKLILFSPDKLKPVVENLPVDGMSDYEKVIYANSITLTPGTLTLDVSKDSLTVHTIQEDLLDSLREDEMSNRIRSAMAKGKS